MNDATADTYGYGLSAVVGAQLFHDVLDVDFDGFFGDEELGGNVAVAIAACDLTQDFDLAGGEGFVTVVFSEVGGDFGGDSFLAGMDLADDLDEFFGWHAFEDISAGSSFESALDFEIGGEGGEDDDAGFWEFGTNGDSGFDAAHVWKAKIHEGDVRRVDAKALNRFAAVGGFGNKGEIGLSLDDGRKTFVK